VVLTGIVHLIGKNAPSTHNNTLFLNELTVIYRVSWNKSVKDWKGVLSGVH
jgi:hypothetical protein